MSFNKALLGPNINGGQFYILNSLKLNKVTFVMGDE